MSKEYPSAKDFRGFESKEDYRVYKYVREPIIEAIESGFYVKRFEYPIREGVVDAIILDMRRVGYWIRYKEYNIRLPLGGDKTISQFEWNVRKPKFAWFRGFYPPG